eukprot:CAMPEP_0174262420 /NCGR_PEP_ID=MMETSP0439-20130205/12964_1 /TAXON_ID=0 /ORGANISM="Stereomyxa ramosa, Strain Chinc5" /LENGTH=668 /DNA_ID=CAMNT_0015347125 /DNA_START=1 /DNA_END=2007 /DNA_ORIENTATION=+
MLSRPSFSAVRGRLPSSQFYFSRQIANGANWQERQFLDPVSKVPTYHYQNSLPRLPVPDLEVTLTKYLCAVRPLIHPSQYAAVEEEVEKFRETGAELQAELVQKDKENPHTCYYSEMWSDMYLSDRQPLPINYNPQMSMKNCVVPEKNEQSRRAAAIIASAARFYRTLSKKVLEPDIFHTQPTKSKAPWFENAIRFVPTSLSWYGAYLVGAYPLDMSQYSRLFLSTRVPKTGKDELLSFPGIQQHKDIHVLVMRNNHFYKLKVYENGMWDTERDILAKVRAILNDKTPPETKLPIGVLSTENRDKWAEARKDLEKENKEALNDVDSGLFCLCLDDHEPKTDAQRCRNFLFGNGRNRWFDKSLSVIIDGGGKLAVNFEHAWGDGVAVLRFFEECFRDMNNTPLLDDRLLPKVAKPERLQWKVNDKISHAIKAAAKRFDDDTNSLNISVETSNVISKQDLKKLKVSPDAFQQMAFQLGYRKLTGNTVATYESASTAAFKHGRTETIRPVCMESLRFTSAFIEKKDHMDCKTFLNEAINQHSENKVQALKGLGFDRHLFALRNLAQQKGVSYPIFENEAYKKLNYNILSTSTLSSPALQLGGFGPVVPDGYGIAYGLDDKWGLNISSYLDARALSQRIMEAADEMKNVLATEIDYQGIFNKINSGDAKKED